MSDDGNTDYFPLRKASEPPDPPSYADGVRFYVDNDAVLRYVLPDGTDAAVGGGGGSQPVQFGTYGGNPITVVSGAGPIDFTVDNFYAGDDLLDLSDPENPAVKADGLYAITAIFASEGTPTDAVAIASLIPQTAAGGVAANCTLGPLSATDVSPQQSVTLVVPMLVDTPGIITAYIQRGEDGGPSNDYALSLLHVTKIS